MPAVAAIDVGSSAIRLLSVQLSAVGEVVDSDYHRYAVRLGGDVFSQGSIGPAHAAALLDVFRDVRNRLDAGGIVRYRAVGTAALREAKNGLAITRRIERETGIRLEIIDGHEERRLARGALVRALGWAPPDAILFDLGGGSLELERVRGRGGGSWPLGTVRMLETYPELRGPIRPAQLRALVDDVYGRLKRYTRMQNEASVLVGSGGTLDFLARHAPHNNRVLPAVDLRRLPKLALRLASMSIEERVETLDLRPDRAELVVAATIVVLALVRRFSARGLLIPGTGIRESVLFQLTEPSAPLEEVRLVAERLGESGRQAKARARLCKELFQITGAAHQLWSPALVPLTAASYFIDAGRRANPDDPAPHAARAIREASELPLCPETREAAVAVVTRALDTRSALREKPLAITADAKSAAAMGGVLAGRRKESGGRNTGATECLAALLKLADTITHCQGTRIHSADPMATPLLIEARAPRRLPARVVEEAGRSLQRPLRVR